MRIRVPGLGIGFMVQVTGAGCKVKGGQFKIHISRFGIFDFGVQI